MIKKLWILIFVAGLCSCENSNEHDKDNSDSEVETQPIEESAEEETQEAVSFKDEVDFAKYCSSQLENGNIDALGSFVRETILFSPYAYIDQSTARKVTLDEIAAHTNDIHYWGVYDGRGDSILMTTPEYLNQFVLRFSLNDEVVKINTYNDKPKAYGNELHNMHKIYPDAMFVEFYHPPSNDGYMDWNALIYVVEMKDDQYILRAIVHNQWTT